jgi:general secretion pathway protein G
MNEPSNTNKGTFERVWSKITWGAIIITIGLAGISIVAVVLPRIPSNTGRVRAATVQIASLGNAFAAFEKENGYFPHGSNGLMYLMQRPPGATNWQGPYINPSIPLDPWGHAYIYECPGRHNPQGYDLSSIAPDGREFGNWKSQ